MSRERFQRVMDIFEAARELSREDRRLHIERACAGDRELREEVESLLRHHEDRGDVLEERPGPRDRDAQRRAAPSFEQDSPSTGLTRWEEGKLFCRVAIDAGYITHREAQDFLRGYRRERSKREVAAALLESKLLAPAELARVREAFEERLEVLRRRRQRATRALASSRDDAPWVGKTIGEYRVEKLLGRGGMGQVYRARHLRLKHEVALKVLRTGGWGGVSLARRFVREAEIAAKLKHPHIVSLRDFGALDPGTFYYTMDLVEGESYAAMLKRELPHPRAAARFIARVAAAVHHAHTKRVIHRDLKPQNIMVNRAGEPVILDFGLAKELDAEASVELSRSGMVIGTPCYMSPEQVDGQVDEVDARSDVYALGATLYESLTGRPPFVGESQLDLLLRIRRDSPIPPRQLNPAVSTELEAICLKCLEKPRSRRYASAADLADDLTALLQNRPIRARPPSALTRTTKFLRRHTALVTATAAVILSLAIGLTLAIHQWQRAEEAIGKVEVAALARDLALGQVEEERIRTAGLTRYVSDLRGEAAAAGELRRELEELRVALDSAEAAATRWRREKDAAEREVEQSREAARRAREQAEATLDLYRRSEEVKREFAARALTAQQSFFELAGLIELLEPVRGLLDRLRHLWRQAVEVSRPKIAAHPAMPEAPWRPEPDEERARIAPHPREEPEADRRRGVRWPFEDPQEEEEWRHAIGGGAMRRRPPSATRPPTRSTGGASRRSSSLGPSSRGPASGGSGYGAGRSVRTGGSGRSR